jgi:hypothetical protein
MKTKVKDLCFNTIQVIKSELQAVLSILTEHDVEDAFKNGRSASDGAYMQKGTAARVMVASRPEAKRRDSISSQHALIASYC